MHSRGSPENICSGLRSHIYYIVRAMDAQWCHPDFDAFALKIYDVLPRVLGGNSVWILVETCRVSRSWMHHSRILIPYYRVGGIKCYQSSRVRVQ